MPKEDVMIEKTVVVSMMGKAEERPVAVLVQVASQYESRVHLVTGDKKINAKSIMGMMSLNLIGGEEITVVTDGEDEQKAAEGIKTFFANV